MAGMRYQPQGPVRLNPSSRLASAAQAVVLGSAPLNLASGKPLTTAGSGVAKLSTPAGIADSFRKNFYRSTELLPAIGTQTFVEFWVGYPSSDLYSKGNGDVGFLTGSSNNSTGIAGSLGTKEIVVGTYAGTDWGAVYNWGTLNTAGEALVAGKLVCLVVVRRQDRMEFWRNGIMVKSVTESPTNYGASKFIVGGFIEDTSYWTASSDMLLAGRAIVDLSTDEVRAFSINPWQLFADPYEDDEIVAAASGGATNTPVGLGVAALALTGYAPTVVRGITTNAAPSAGALAVTGYAPSVTQGLTTSVSPAARTLALTGYAPSVTQTALKSASPTPANLAITGYAPTVTRGANQTIPAGAAMPSTLVLTGYAPTVQQQAPVINVSVRFDVLPRDFRTKIIHFSN
jgi:hypothetical protein